MRELENKLINLKEDITSRLDDHDLKFKEVNYKLITKVDCEFFDEEMNNLKTAITALSTTSGSDDKKPV